MEGYDIPIIDPPPRRAVDITMTVQIDDTRREFTVDSTTTGDAARVASKLIFAVKSDADHWIAQQEEAGREQAPDGGARRRAVVTAVMVVAGVRRDWESDTTTTGSVYDAADQLVEAAWSELSQWAREGTRP